MVVTLAGSWFRYTPRSTSEDWVMLIVSSPNDRQRPNITLQWLPGFDAWPMFTRSPDMEMLSSMIDSVASIEIASW